jgi:hypothetical protein
VPPSRRAALSFSPRPLTAPPSHCLISPAGCCVASHCTALSLSSYSAALIVLRWLVVELTLIAPPSCRAALSSCRPLVLSSSSHCAALLLSHLTGCLLRRLSSHRPLVILLLRHPLVVLRKLVVALTLIVPPSCPLIMPLSCPLVVLYLKLVKPGCLDPFDATFVVPRERSSCTSPAWPLAHARWSHRRDQTSSKDRMSMTLPCLTQLYSSPDTSAGSAS